MKKPDIKQFQFSKISDEDERANIFSELINSDRKITFTDNDKNKYKCIAKFRDDENFRLYLKFIDEPPQDFDKDDKFIVSYKLGFEMFFLRTKLYNINDDKKDEDEDEEEFEITEEEKEKLKKLAAAAKALQGDAGDEATSEGELEESGCSDVEGEGDPDEELEFYISSKSGLYRAEREGSFTVEFPPDFGAWYSVGSPDEKTAGREFRIVKISSNAVTFQLPRDASKSDNDQAKDDEIDQLKADFGRFKTKKEEAKEEVIDYQGFKMNETYLGHITLGRSLRKLVRGKVRDVTKVGDAGKPKDTRITIVFLDFTEADEQEVTKSLWDVIRELKAIEEDKKEAEEKLKQEEAAKAVEKAGGS